MSYKKSEVIDTDAYAYGDSSQQYLKDFQVV